MIAALRYTNTKSLIFEMPTHENNGSQVEMSLYSDPLYGLQAVHLIIFTRIINTVVLRSNHSTIEASTPTYSKHKNVQLLKVYLITK